MTGQPHVVIVGGGFGGLYAARALRRAPVRVTLVDRRNHHLFQPLLYQVATAALNPSDIAAPIRSILNDQGLKTIEDAIEVRRRVLLAYEAAERETDLDRRDAWLTFVIIGAGPTGVEMAGALSEIARHSLTRDFDTIDPRSARVVLTWGQDRVLPSYHADLSRSARVQLERLAVEVRVGARVTAVAASGVSIGQERIAARTVIWAAGVEASPLAGSLGVPLDRAGRVRVRPDLTIPGCDEVFVIGDLASLEQDGRPLPGVSPVAMQQGRQAAANVLRRVRGQATRPFRYLDKGSFAVIGRGAAVGDLYGRLCLSGFPAWLAWLGIHIFFLIGFRNRLLVIFGWAYSYLTWRRGARLITGGGPPMPIGR